MIIECDGYSCEHSFCRNSRLVNKKRDQEEGVIIPLDEQVEDDVVVVDKIKRLKREDKLI